MTDTFQIRRSAVFDSKMLIVILAIALVIFGTKRLRTIGSDLGAAMNGFKQAVSDAEVEGSGTRGKQDAGPARDPAAGARDGDVKESANPSDS
jgi:sec-independent protein translocase protein TatA